MKMPEVQDIFRLFGEEYRGKYNLPLNHYKVMGAIENCRTSNLGAHIEECMSCGYKKISYNSCRNRHCPKCQSFAKEKWLEERRQDLLPIQYFHIVFTIPDTLKDLCLRNPEEMYKLLFKASAETLLELSQDIKYLGGQIGFSSILHTWGQNLMYHPHIHCIVTGGGLDQANRYFIHSKKKFFIPVKVLSDKFRKKFLFYLKHAYYINKLNSLGRVSDLNEKSFRELVNDEYKKKWVVYCKKPFGHASQVLEYLGRYTHRVAISNHRIKKIEGRKVYFEWKDYKENSKKKVMVLDGVEFVRRFMLHVLPRKFVKIRHYGIISNRNRRTKLKISKKLLYKRKVEKLNTRELILKITGIDIGKCPCCGENKIIRYKKLGLEKAIPL